MKKILDLKNWRFKIDTLKIEKDITLPHTWNVDDDREIQLYRGNATYETQVNIESVANKAMILYVGAAYHTANIYINDCLAGYHSGCGNTPFETDITPYMAQGANRIRIDVNNKAKNEMLPHGLDYDWADDGGLTRDVKLTVFENTDLFGMTVDYTLDTIGKGVCSGQFHIFLDAEPQTVTAEIIDFQTKETVLSVDAFVDGGISVPFENLKLWNTESPNLYSIKICSDDDVIEKRTGLRTVEVKGAKVLLNGEELYLKGCEWMPGAHPDYGMAEPLSHSIKCLSQLKNAGCVFTRFHWQQDTTLLDWCDENGLLVQEEIPYWGYPKKATPLQLEIAEMQAEDMVYYHGHHPSVICWGVGNELGGEFPETIAYVKQMYAYFKSLDGSRLVNYVSNSVCRDTNVELDDATMYGDIAMWNEYLGLWQPCDDIEGVIKRTYAKFGDMPSMVTEFGLCEPAFDGGDERRIQILLQRIPLYKKLPNMVGYVWFSLNDYRTHCGEYGDGKLKQRIHGSTDLYGKEKPSYRVFAEVNQE